MRATRLTRLLVATAGIMFLAGFLTLTLAPSALGLGLILYLLHTRGSASSVFAATRVHATRRVLEPVLHEDSVFTVELDSTRSELPPGVALTIEDHPPDAIVPLDSPRADRPGIMTYRARARAKGVIGFTSVRATIRDSRGLWESRRDLHVETTIQVLASRAAIESGKRLARRHPIESTSRNPIGLIVKDLEFEGLRDYAPGDRLRDVAWKRLAHNRKLMTKAWEKELEAAIVLVVDAGRTMRAGFDGSSKLDHASYLALELAEAANERNHRVGCVVFDEATVLDEVQLTRDRALPRLVATRLANLPGRILVKRRLDVGLPGGSAVDEDEIDYLSALSGALGARPSRVGARTGIDVAVDRILRQSGTDKTFLILFSDLEALPDPAVAALRKAAGAGHRVLCVLLPGSRYLAPPKEPTPSDLANAYREELVRRRARVSLSRRGVRFVELGPQDTAAAITRASKSVEARASGGISR